MIINTNPQCAILRLLYSSELVVCGTMNHSHLCASQAGLYTAVAIYFLCGNAVLLPW